jgi:hypothetical protein
MALAAIELEGLMEVVVAALIAGVGVTVVFSMVIYFATRASELRQSDAPVLALVLGSIAALGLVACLAGVAFGIHVMTQK